MLMYLRYLLVLLVSFSLSGCLYQQPAPIEYGSSVAQKTSDDYYDASSKKEEKIKVTTFWGGKEVKEKKKEIEEKPLMLSEEATGKEIYHEVIEGETIDSIAKKYGIARSVLIKKNDLEPPYVLEELQLIMIPPKGSIDPIEIKKKPVDTKVAPARAGKMPVEGKIVSSFGQRYLGAINQGINISAAMDADIFSSSSGEVIHSAYDPKFGNLIIIKSHDEDIFMAYAHMTDLSLKVGQNIAEGQVVGHVGQTGKVTKPQLHFAVRKGKIPIDPVGYLKK
jgi:murein DD-endopeptidase MepM/ murein hydrolase activator NlpD